MPELNQELIRQKFIEIFNQYSKPASLNQMKEIVKDYDEVRELLDESLNIAIGIMEAIIKKEIKDKKEEKTYVDDIKKELEDKSYL